MLYLPTPSSLNYFWNFGSMLGLMMMSQILTGFFLTMFYCPSTLMAFDSVIHVMNDVNWGWCMRFFHSTGASVFFIFCYTHISKALFYNSFYMWKVWFSGLGLVLLLMGVAFLGYVLPWGQMSMWGATVITNLISVVPYVGPTLVSWLWGGFNVDAPTLSRFFSFHFVFPFVMIVFILVHLMLLHELGSSNPLGLPLNLDKVSFKNFFIIKDFYTFILSFLLLIILSFWVPFFFMDSENFMNANPMITPIHIQPEWYFLFAYAILRAIPNKLGGVIMLLLSIIMVFLLPLWHSSKLKGARFKSANSKVFLFTLLSIFCMLTWLGMKPVESPFIMMSKVYSFLYFISLLFMTM